MAWFIHNVIMNDDNSNWVCSLIHTKQGDFRMCTPNDDYFKIKGFEKVIGLYGNSELKKLWTPCSKPTVGSFVSDDLVLQKGNLVA